MMEDWKQWLKPKWIALAVVAVAVFIVLVAG